MGIGIVETKFGKMSGVECDGKFSNLTIFKGVPYAKPPVGDLRWKAPQDPEPWDGVRVCDKFGDAAIQIFDKRRLYYEFYEHVGLPNMSEDCLYLNICTAAQSPDERRPVLMWFHGGGFTDSYAYEPQFDPRVLASKGVVVVTVGIRLGVFGYMALPQLSEEQGGHSGNYSVMDQVKALDWIYENIAAFGGDPEMITAGGQSGGATKAEVLATIPASRGRIKRLIAQSGLRWYYKFKTQEEMEKISRNYLKLANVDPDLPLEQLRAMDTLELFDRNIDRFKMPGAISQDMITVPYTDMREAFEAGIDGIDFLNGCNLGEPDMFAESFAGFNKVSIKEFSKEKEVRTAKDFYAHFKNLLGELYDEYDFESLVQVTDETAWDEFRRLATLGLVGREGPNISRNLMLNRLFGRYVKKRSPESKVYTYMWSHLLPIVEAKKGSELDTAVELAWHTSEFWFTFGSLREGMPPHRPWRDIDYKLADIVTDYWANFIISGDPNTPNGAENPYWPVTSDEFGYMEIGTNPQGHNGLETKLDELCRKFVNAEYQLDL